MAAFHQHIAFSAFTGAVYSATLWYSECVEAPVAIFAGAACTLAGMLPDLDSDSGKPVREIFHLVATVGALVTMHRLRHVAILPAESVLLVAAGVYLSLRYAGATLFRCLTVHRGMFHSLPAALLAGGITFLLYDPPSLLGRWVVAAAVALGYASHLVLDAIWQLRTLNGAWSLLHGGPLKLFGASRLANFVCWSLLLLVSYLVAIDQNWLQPMEPYTRNWLTALGKSPL